jgi:hypothetical protein
VRDEVGPEDLHDLPADAGHDGDDVQVTGRYLAGREHAKGDHKEPYVDERGEWDRGDAKPSAHGRTEGARVGGQSRECRGDEDTGAEHEQQEQAAQTQGDRVRSLVARHGPRPVERTHSA